MFSDICSLPLFDCEPKVRCDLAVKNSSICVISQRLKVTAVVRVVRVVRGYILAFPKSRNILKYIGEVLPEPGGFGERISVI
jgi:hypothetical protein